MGFLQECELPISFCEQMLAGGQSVNHLRGSRSIARTSQDKQNLSPEIKALLIIKTVQV